MRIVYVITRSDAIGGAVIHLRDFTLAMRRAGHDASVLIGGEGSVTQEFRDKGVPYEALRYLRREIHPTNDVRAFWELRHALKRLSPDLVSTHCGKAGCLGRLAARTLGLPVIFTAHGWTFTDGVTPRKAWAYRWAERMASPLADKIITVSEYDRALAIEQRVARSRQMVAIHNGMPDVAPALRADAAASPPRIVMVARFEPQKDHTTALTALAAVRDLPWEIEFIGDGPLLGPAMEMAGRLGLTERVHFVGARRDVPERLASAQLFLLISNWEGFPRSILEAMRACLPAVVSDVGGSAESVVDTETGFVIARGDASTLAARLRLLLSDPALRARMGAAGRHRYEQQFTAQRMFQRTLEVYEGVLRRKPRYAALARSLSAGVLGEAPRDGMTVLAPAQVQRAGRVLAHGKAIAPVRTEGNPRAAEEAVG
jgi:glycosyltransferase involved in cell wall biosynthesis